MVNQSKKEYVEVMRRRYAGAGRAYKKKLLDEVCEVCGYHRKYAIELLNRKPSPKRGRPGPRRLYGEAVREVLKDLWLLMDRPCSKLLKANIPLWLPHYERDHPTVPALRVGVLQISPASMDRLLKPVRKQYGSHGLGTTRPICPLKHQVPIRTHHTQVAEPGYLQADSVAHGGDSTEGDFVWSLTLTDVFSQWTESRAVWNKGYSDIARSIEQIEQVLPFRIRGFHSDNGGEFLNHHLYRYFRNRDVQVHQTRTRPDHKDDNAYVEQKNWIHVRQLLGYQRIEDPKLLPTINHLYEAWSLYRNFFCSTQKLLSKTKVGSRYRRRYEPEPRTPAQRLFDAPGTNEAIKTHLTELRLNLNPLRLKRFIDHHQHLVLSALR
jgi:hypothetical protein